jgi:hypothetical protein
MYQVSLTLLLLVAPLSAFADAVGEPAVRFEEPLLLAPLQPEKTSEIALTPVAVGGKSSTVWALKNSGSRPFEVRSIEVDEPFYLEGKSCEGKWEPGQSCELGLRFEPREPGAFAATVTVKIRGEYEEDLIPLRVTGSGLRPAQLEIEGETAFGQVAVGTPAARELKVKNSGEGEAKNIALKVSGQGFEASGCGPVLAAGQRPAKAAC